MTAANIRVFGRAIFMVVIGVAGIVLTCRYVSREWAEPIAVLGLGVWAIAFWGVMCIGEKP